MTYHDVVNCVLIHVSRESSEQAGFSRREKTARPKFNFATAFLFHRKFGLLNHVGLPSTVQPGEWFKCEVKFDETPFTPTAHWTGKVLSQVEIECQVARTVNEHGTAFTRYIDSGIIIEIHQECMLIWNDTIGLVVHFNETLDLETEYRLLQPVKFKADSMSESRHCAFHAIQVEPVRSVRFENIFFSKNAQVFSFLNKLYAIAENGEGVLLLDVNGKSLLQSTESQIKEGDFIDLIYYEINTQHGSLYISAFYCTKGEDERVDEQMNSLNKTARALSEDDYDDYASKQLKNEISPEKFAQLWEKRFDKFWNPEERDNKFLKLYIEMQAEKMMEKVRKAQEREAALAEKKKETKKSSLPQIEQLSISHASSSSVPPANKILPMPLIKSENLKPQPDPVKTENNIHSNTIGEKIIQVNDQDILTFPDGQNIAISSLYQLMATREVLCAKRLEEILTAPPLTSATERERNNNTSIEYFKSNNDTSNQSQYYDSVEDNNIYLPSSNPGLQPIPSSSQKDCIPRASNALTQQDNVNPQPTIKQIGFGFGLGLPVNKKATSEERLATSPSRKIINSPLEEKRNDVLKELKLPDKRDDENLVDYLERNLGPGDNTMQKSFRKFLTRLIHRAILKELKALNKGVYTVLRNLYSYPSRVCIQDLQEIGVINIISSGSAHIDRYTIEQYLVKVIYESSTIWKFVVRTYPNVENEIRVYHDHLSYSLNMDMSS